jgi:succinylarginine dihydrolase
MTMPERTDHTDWDNILRRVLSEPSTAARILTATAAILDGDPHLTVNAFSLDYAAKLATEMVTEQLPAVVATEALSAAHRALPLGRPGGTCGEYAQLLRAAAKTV